MSLQEAINNLYEVFKDYHVTKMEKCTCGCISEDQEAEVYAKPLQKLLGENLNFYAHKAMTTWGNENDFKHFLPRLLEVCFFDETFYKDLKHIYSKLEYAHWENWEETEQQAIIDFVKSSWKEYVNSRNNLDSFDSSGYIDFLSVEEMIRVWDFMNNKQALHNFVDYFCYEGNMLVYQQNKTISDEQLVSLLETDGLLERLEKTFQEE